jgi:hypothetical protein
MDIGSATSDSDIFVLSVDEFLPAAEPAINLTNSPDYIDDDPDGRPTARGYCSRDTASTICTATPSPLKSTELSSQTFCNFVRDFSSFQAARALTGGAGLIPNTVLSVLLT